MTFASYYINKYRKKGDEKEYFVKWKELPYDECSWEVESDISAFQLQIERFRMIQSRAQKSSSKHKISIGDTKELKNKQNEFQHYGNSPGFLHGGVSFLIFMYNMIL